MELDRLLKGMFVIMGDSTGKGAERYVYNDGK